MFVRGLPKIEHFKMFVRGLSKIAPQNVRTLPTWTPCEHSSSGMGMFVRRRRAPRANISLHGRECSYGGEAQYTPILWITPVRTFHFRDDHTAALACGMHREVKCSYGGDAPRDVRTGCIQREMFVRGRSTHGFQKCSYGVEYSTPYEHFPEGGPRTNIPAECSYGGDGTLECSYGVDPAPLNKCSYGVDVKKARNSLYGVYVDPVRTFIFQKMFVRGRAKCWVSPAMVAPPSPPALRTYLHT